jgi:hypothetical protein
MDKQTVADAYVYLLGRAIVIRQEQTDLDVAYVEAWIPVDDKTPVLLEVPEVKERYYTAQILDEEILSPMVAGTFIGYWTRRRVDRQSRLQP